MEGAHKNNTFAFVQSTDRLLHLKEKLTIDFVWNYVNNNIILVMLLKFKSMILLLNMTNQMTMQNKKHGRINKHMHKHTTAN